MGDPHERLKLLRHDLNEVLSALRNAAWLIGDLQPVRAGSGQPLDSIEQRCRALLELSNSFLAPGGILEARFSPCAEAPAWAQLPERAWAWHEPLAQVIASFVRCLHVDSLKLWELWHQLIGEHHASLNASMQRLCRVAEQECQVLLEIVGQLHVHLLSMLSDKSEAGSGLPAPPAQLHGAPGQRRR